MKKIQIKNKENVILFEFEKEENTIKDTLIEGIKQGIDFNNANLRGANLRGADLMGANLIGAKLNDANLIGTNLMGADLIDANLFCANLSYANLSYTNLNGANLRGANLIDANLIGADLRGAKSVPYIPLVCPSDGEFIGWKKVKSCLIKLKIPFDAKRSSATSQKCRCDKAMVLEIIDLLHNNEPIEEIMNDLQKVPLLYRVGEMVYPDSFDENRWNECSNGIHFFINKEEAIRY